MNRFLNSRMQENQLSPTVATNVVILDSKEKVLLTRRADNHLWCLPGGMLEIGETIEACARREVYEEIGCRVKIGNLIGIYSAPNIKLTPPARFHLIVVCVFAEIVKGIPDVSDEVLESKYFDGCDLPSMVPNQSERIQHALNFRTAILL